MRKRLSPIAMADVDPAAWEALASRRIFFGHQSVGRDIVGGMARVLADHPEIGVRVVGADDPEQVNGPAFIEARIGRNREPDTKSDAFSALLAKGFGDEGDSAIAMYKFCYVDVSPGTDPEQLFDHYVANIEAVRTRYPALTIAHCTLPLKRAPAGIAERIRTTIGVPTETRLNHERNRYNDLLRAKYGSLEPVFDIALLESTRADGTRAFTRFRGRRVFMLAPEWTTDGGHLNEEAQYRVAQQLLIFLAQLDVTARAIDVADVERAAQ